MSSETKFHPHLLVMMLLHFITSIIIQLGLLVHTVFND